MAVIKVELVNKDLTPVYFHTSSDIVYFNSRLTTGLTGKTVQDAIVGLNKRLSEMIVYNEDLMKQVVSMRSEVKSISDTMGSSTLHFTQAVSIKTDYWEATSKDQPPYTAVLKLPAVRATDVVIINPVQHADIGRAQKQLEAYNCISNLIIGDGTITLKCYEMKPMTSIPVQVVVFRTKGN